MKELFPQRENTSAAVLNKLKENAMDIGQLQIIGQSTENMHMQPNTWNETNGVIVFSDENGKIFASPATEKIRSELVNNAVEQDVSIGVPALNNKENWGSSEYSFSQWKKLAESKKEESETAIQTKENEQSGISTELSEEEINAISKKEDIPPTPKEEAYDFTKKYSGFWRDQMAEKIREIRASVREKKASIANQNLENTTKKEATEIEIANLENSAGEIQKNIEVKQGELEKEKNKITYKIANFFGIKKELPGEPGLSDLEIKSENLQKNIAEKKEIINEFGEVVLDENEADEAKNELRKFYEEQSGIKEKFEQEKSKERDINSLSQEKNVIFLHTLQYDSDTANFGKIKVTAMDRARMVMGVEPTISVSTVNLSGEDTESKTFTPIGLIVGEGTVLSAYGSDAGTYADNPFIRRSTYDKNLKSSVQENIEKNTEKALKRERGDWDIQVGEWNEIVVEKPKVAGVFIDTTRLSGFSNAKEAMKQAFDIGKEFGLPVYNIQPNGEIIDLLSDDFNKVTQEEALSNKRNLSLEERIVEIKKVIESQENPDPLIQNKIAEIDGAQEISQTEKEKQSTYSNKAEDLSNAIEYEKVAAYMIKMIDKLGGSADFETIIKTAREEGVNEAGLVKMNFFQGKSSEEIKSLSEQILQNSQKIQKMLDNGAETQKQLENLREERRKMEIESIRQKTQTMEEEQMDEIRRKIQTQFEGK
ncbi:MAG: hypothetical protein NTZ13_03215 [Candidatus Parcubacteria bacterium]|nr:hypothetical protein [Candidatus Parcubacteria bacterium]